MKIIDAEVWYGTDCIPVSDAFDRAAVEGVAVLDFHDGCGLGDSVLKPLQNEEEVRTWVDIRYRQFLVGGNDIDFFLTRENEEWVPRSAAYMAQKVGLIKCPA